MPKIKKLSDHEARKIAAGEVVEKPANIVKELIENSIDAGANIITIYLENSGKKLIRVIDNGCGMSKEDAQLCFAHHATSKIDRIEDLQTLTTFGFRGEALSSISAVSKIKLITKQKEDKEGICLILEDSLIIKQEQIACQDGTDLSVENIFYNIPARLKFLKKDESELRQIVQIFQAICLSNLNIHFKIYHDNKLLYNCPVVKNLSSRIEQLWENSFAQSLLELGITQKDIDLKINGLISNQHVYRFNRSQIFLFVNNRWIKNQSLVKAILKGYKNVLPKDKFPAAFIFISINQQYIDINVHPRKEEVQFLQSSKIENLLENNIKQVLEKNLTVQIKKSNFFNESNSRYIAATQAAFDFEQLQYFEPIDSTSRNNNSSNFAVAEQKIDLAVSSQIITDASVIPTQSMSDNSEIKYQIIGQYKNCYILLETTDGLFIIDQHAAHERILYELFSLNFSQVAKVKLIFPVIITLTEQNLNILLPYLDLLLNYGIEAECFAKDQLVVNSIPVHLKDLSLNDLINQLVSWIEEYQFLEQKEFFKLINEKLCAQMACKAAIKAGDKLQSEQMVQLLQDLQKTENRFCCPHGRPTGWLINHYEIEKKFKRK